MQFGNFSYNFDWTTLRNARNHVCFRNKLYCIRHLVSLRCQEIVKIIILCRSKLLLTISPLGKRLYVSFEFIICAIVRETIQAWYFLVLFKLFLYLKYLTFEGVQCQISYCPLYNLFKSRSWIFTFISLKSRMELATVHKYSIFIEFPQDGAYMLVEMQHCINSVKLLHEMLN